MRKVVLNTSSLSSFIATDSLSIVSQLFPSILVPNGVVTEIKRRYALPRGITVRTLNDGQKKRARQIGFALGENEAIILARDTGRGLVIDDGPPRNAAKKMGLDVISSLYTISIAYKQCLLNRSEYEDVVRRYRREKRARQQNIDHVLTFQK